MCIKDTNMTRGTLVCCDHQPCVAGNSINSDIHKLNTDNDNKIISKDGYTPSYSMSTWTDKNQNIVSDINNNIDVINIAEYVQNLPQNVRNKIAGFFGTGIIDQSLIDIENIEHYLIVSRHSNPLKQACESKLLSSLNSENSLTYMKFAEKFNLLSLKDSARQIANNIKYTMQDTKDTNQRPSRELSVSCRNYNAVFTCDTTSKKRAVSVSVLNSAQEVRCYRNLQRGDKISKQFQCCCLQDDEQHEPYIFWSFGSSFYRYDPVLNKLKKRAPLRCHRANFSLVALNQCCYAIGGERGGLTVRFIEEYNVKRKTWKVVAELPPECKMTYGSCAVVDNLIYIFSGATNGENCFQNRTVVCVFDPVTKTVNLCREIPVSFTQIKTCVVGDDIYIASSEGNFIKYSTIDGSFNECKDQILKCKDFGMYSENDAIFLVGGINSDGKCNNSIRKFNTKTGYWERLSQKLPDPVRVYGTCAIKIPMNCSIVPCYKSKFFEIHPRCV